MPLCILVAGFGAQADAEFVDSELILLIDVTSRGFNGNEFDDVINGYASALTSSEVIDSIQSGAYGRIAVSMMFYGDATTQVVGIPWMMIGSAAEAEEFATLVRGVNRPGAGGSPAPGPALAAAMMYFGTETGGADNGFESSVQIIDLAAGSAPTGGGLAGVSAARDSALAAGVDVINAIAMGKKADAFENYYAANVIGGEAGGVSATSSSSAIDGSIAANLVSQISGEVNAGAAESLAAIPEPSPALAILSGLAVLLIRRRRDS